MGKLKDRSDSFEARKPIIEAFPLDTLKQIINCADHLHREKIGFKEICRNQVVSYTFGQFVDEVRAIGTTLMHEGLEGKHMAVLGENSYGWVQAYMTTVCMGTIVPLDKELTFDDLCQLLESADCEYIFVSAKYLKTARAVKEKNSEIKGLFVWGEVSELYENEFSYETLIQKGQLLIEEGETMYLNREVDKNDLAAIVFTSGTTGLNKGVMLTHNNICANMRSVAACFPYEFVTFSVLPLTHTYEMNCHMLPGIFFGVEICLNASLKRMIKNLQEFKPGMALVVPMFIDELYNVIWINAKNQGRIKLLEKALIISKFAMKLGLDIRRIMFKEIHDIFGGNLSLLVCGGAPLNATAAKGMSDFGFDIVQGYGITECSPLVAVNLEGTRNMESVGPSVPGVEVKIDDLDAYGIGEILVKSESCTIGYYKDPDSTEKVFTDGWYRTGDYGRLDNKGRIWLSGRKKNLIILANGKNVYPEEIENEIAKAMTYIKDVVVYDEKRKIQGKEAHVITAALSVRDDAEIATLSEEERNAKILQDIRKVNKNLAAYKRISMFSVSMKEFKKNAAKKIVRSKMKKADKASFIQV